MKQCSVPVILQVKYILFILFYNEEKRTLSLSGFCTRPHPFYVTIPSRVNHSGEFCKLAELKSLLKCKVIYEQNLNFLETITVKLKDKKGRCNSLGTNSRCALFCCTLL